MDRAKYQYVNEPWTRGWAAKQAMNIMNKDVIARAAARKETFKNGFDNHMTKSKGISLFFATFHS